MDESTYHDVPIGDLSINDVEWAPVEAAHIRHRAERKDQPGEMNIEPEWATEAAVDPFAIRRLPKQQPSRSLIVVGWSEAAQAVLRVFLIPVDLDAGRWRGTTAARRRIGWPGSTGAFERSRRGEREGSRGDRPRGG